MLSLNSVDGTQAISHSTRQAPPSSASSSSFSSSFASNSIRWLVSRGADVASRDSVKGPHAGQDESTPCFVAPKDGDAKEDDASVV
jgi:hypothetical protein